MSLGATWCGQHIGHNFSIFRNSTRTNASLVFQVSGFLDKNNALYFRKHIISFVCRSLRERELTGSSKCGPQFLFHSILQASMIIIIIICYNLFSCLFLPSVFQARLMNEHNVRRQRHKVSGIQGIGRLSGSPAYRSRQQTRYKALYFQALPLKAHLRL